jgi:arylsulfatase A-like enzyme
MPGFMQTSHIAVHIEDEDYLKTLPEGWYSSDYYADTMIKYLKDRVTRKEERPFFGYLAFTAPHWPLQAPKEYIEHYKGFYETGPEGLRQTRLQKMIDLKLMGSDVVPHPIVGDEVKAWEEMSVKERAKSSKAMEAYAGMVEVSLHSASWLSKVESPSLWTTILARCWMNSRLKGNLTTRLSCF